MAEFQKVYNKGGRPMKKENVCPGCGRHCPLNQPRCKYGRAYQQKMEKKKADHSEKHYKWEKYTEKCGLAWKFFLAGRNMKKSLRNGMMTEDKIWEKLSREEMETLEKILIKINENF